MPVSDLIRVVRYVETLTGETASDGRQLGRRCRELLSDPDTAAALLALMSRLGGSDLVGLANDLPEGLFVKTGS